MNAPYLHQPQLKRGDRVLWLPFWMGGEDNATPGTITSARKSLKPYAYAVLLDGDVHGPTAAYASELRPMPVENSDG